MPDAPAITPESTTTQPASTSSNSRIISDNTSQLSTFTVIDANGDIAIRLYEDYVSETFLSDDGVTMKKGRVLVTFQVSTQVLKDHSTFFTQSFSSPWRRPGQLEFDLGEKHVAALELCLRVLHGNLDDDSYKIKIADIWFAIQFCRKYLLPIEKLNDWFAEWARRNGATFMGSFNLDELRLLLYPCFELDYAHGFANVTRRLAYEVSGGISEDNPIGDWGLHLHSRVICKLCC